MDEAIAFFITVSTYGSWLPGDGRGWIEYRRGWQLPDPVKELEARARMAEDACVLSPYERRIVERQLEQTCFHRSWTLHARNCRSNHFHAVIAAVDIAPDKIRRDIKAWCSRRLKERSFRERDNWWSERGSIRHVYDEDGLDAVIQYVNDAQDRKHLYHQS